MKYKHCKRRCCKNCIYGKSENDETYICELFGTRHYKKILMTITNEDFSKKVNFSHWNKLDITDCGSYKNKYISYKLK